MTEILKAGLSSVVGMWNSQERKTIKKGHPGAQSIPHAGANKLWLHAISYNASKSSRPSTKNAFRFFLFLIWSFAPLVTRAHNLKGAVKVSMLSPGIIYEPYAPREKIPFWKRYFTRNGWKRIKEELTSELKSAYAIAKLRKAGYSKQKFYTEAVSIYKEINTQMANGGKATLRKSVTEHMYSVGSFSWYFNSEFIPSLQSCCVGPLLQRRTLLLLQIGVDRNDLSKVFIQLTLEFLSKQKFEAYDGKGAVVSGDKNKEVLVRDIWVFEKSLFHPGAYWRLCGRIKV
ncbi:hypothetical protein RND71_041057 [Anisodus tanguticus]|uniref:Large ribosomal subunit protein mL45 n=1 Tax=Anisodus tanguticus TaxID=243964 RepID=A0AAE1UWB8_9SOLA|nr:hypothetical protein RND71_041057 [Anisodus tanguticus]